LSRLPAASGAEVVKALKRAGFLVRRQESSHVILRHPETRVTVPVPVHGGRDVPTGTLRDIIRDAGLTVDGFTRLLK